MRHLFEVASGIDSPVLGEGEILRQVRAARTSRPAVNGLRVRCSTGCSVTRSRSASAPGPRPGSCAASPRSPTSRWRSPTETLGGSLAGRRVVVVGAGEMGEGIVAALMAAAQPAELVVASRSREKADAAAGAVGGRGVALGELGAELADADVLFTATAAPEILLGPEDLRRARADRPRRPLLIIDAAVPRDVDPAVASFPDVTLRDVDDLRNFAERSLAARRAEIDRVREIIDEELGRYSLDARGRAVAPVVAALHDHAERIRSVELARIDPVLARLGADERDAIESVTRRIVAKLVHEPTVNVKSAAGSARGERLAEALRALFDL